MSPVIWSLQLPSAHQIGARVHVHSHGWLGRTGTVVGVKFMQNSDICKVLYDVEDDRGRTAEGVLSEDVEGASLEHS